MIGDRGRLILLVEGDPSAAAEEAVRLERRGYRVESASSGDAAIERCRLDPRVELVLLDLDLGDGLDGPQTATAILRQRELPIVFLSSLSETEAVERAESVASYGYLAKGSGIAMVDASIQVALRLFEAKRRLWEEKERLRFALEPDQGAEYPVPSEAAATVSFEELFDLPSIQRIQDEIASAMGVSSIITRPDGTPLTAPSRFTRLCREIIRKSELGCANCRKSNALMGRLDEEGPVVQSCLSGGLWDAGASMVVGGQHIANWLVGQVRDGAQTEAGIRRYAREIGVDEDEVALAFSEVPSMSRERFGAVAAAVHSLAGQLSALAYMNVQQARLIAEKNRSEEKAKALLLEKELILKEVHHRIKNNLGAVYSTLALQAEVTQEQSAKRILRDAGSRVQSMLMLYDILYRSGRFNSVSVVLYLPPLIDQIVGLFPNREAVTVEKVIEPFVLDAKRLQALGVIINELLTNIMKYAFAGRRQGRITVSATLAGDRVTISIQDDGIGLPVSINFHNSTGFGLMLVEGLAKQLKAVLRIERRKGTKILLDFMK